MLKSQQKAFYLFLQFVEPYGVLTFIGRDGEA